MQDQQRLYRSHQLLGEHVMLHRHDHVSARHEPLSKLRQLLVCFFQQ